MTHPAARKSPTQRLGNVLKFLSTDVPSGNDSHGLCLRGLEVSTYPVKVLPADWSTVAERRIRLIVIAVVCHAKRVPGIQGEIVRLARVRDGVIVRQQRAAIRERIDIRRLRVANDLVEGVDSLRRQPRYGRTPA